MRKSFKDVLLKVEQDVEALPIVTDLKILHTKSDEATMEEAEEIWPKLKVSLDTKRGFGISAIQIGIPKKVGYVNFEGNEYFLLNTKIVQTGYITQIPDEGCISLPGISLTTERYAEIILQDDILGRLAISMEQFRMLPIIMQHEVDHFNGLTIFDRKLDAKPLIVEDSVGRNDICPCGSGIKYKKCCGKP